MSDAATYAWLELLTKVLTDGRPVSPRGRDTLELPQQTVEVDMTRPAVICPVRRLSNQFMAAEAYWILSGDNSVAGIAPYNKNIAAFSDDGVVFAGAYGPRIAEQLDYVVGKLCFDNDTRQAGLTIWKPNPKPSKDIPCTIAVWFQLRARKLNCHVFMRSSDLWLGLPYDVFNFSMLATLVCGKLPIEDLVPGTLYLTAASSHLYSDNITAAKLVLHSNRSPYVPCKPTPAKLLNDPAQLLQQLADARTIEAARWWL